MASEPDLNPLDYHFWGAMLEVWTLQVISTQPVNIDELKKVDMGPDSINKAILSFPKRLRACVKAGGGHFEHTLKWTASEILVFVVTVNVSWQWKLKVAVDYSMQNWKYGIEYLYNHNFGEN